MKLSWDYEIEEWRRHTRKQYKKQKKIMEGRVCRKQSGTKYREKCIKKEYKERDNFYMGIAKEQLKTPDIIYRPEVRWWLAEGFHTDETLKNDIKMLHDAGFGAAEFLAMGEAGADSSVYGWGSEEWVHDSNLVIEEATKRGMGASVTSGTNWSNANLTSIVPDDKAAAKELDFMAETVKAGKTRTGRLKKCNIVMPNVNVQELVAVVAGKVIGADEEAAILDKSSLIVLTGSVQEESLIFRAPEDGDYELFTFWLHGTGQTAEPSVSISYTVNYLDQYGVKALIDYWEKELMKPELVRRIKENSRVMMYMDSLEVSTYGKGGVFWGYHLLEEFKKRRGYDLTPYLPYIIKRSKGMMMPGVFYYEAEDKTWISKLRNDFYQTLTDLYMENMLHPFREWLHSAGMELRAEISYGMPFEISQPGKYVDGIETESLEFASQIDAYRGLAGTAHLYNRLFSSETGATLFNYMLGLDFYTQIIYTQFAAGINKTVLHGYSSIAGSEASTYWPGHEGMLPVFSERFGCRQPAWQHYKDWTDMIARYQMLLRQGSPRLDIGILRLDYYFNNMYMMYGNEKETYEQKLMRANEGIYWKDMKLQNAGYTYDYFAPQLLEEDNIVYENGMVTPKGPGYQALIIYQEVMPVNSARKILDWAREGLPVILVNGVTETIHVGKDEFHKKAASMTPFNDGKDEELKAVMDELRKLRNVAEIWDQSKTKETLAALGVLPRAAFTEENKNILTFMRTGEDTDYLFVYNYMYTRREESTVTLNIKGCGKPYRIHCWTGTEEEVAVYEEKNGRIQVKVTLKPGEATILALHKKENDALHAVSCDADALYLENGVYSVAAAKSGTYEVVFSDGTIIKKQITVPDKIFPDVWELEVEDWNEGDKVTITEDRGLGVVTKEIYYRTKKTRIPVGKTDLKPWKDISQIGEEVSGVGYYTTTVKLPSDWCEKNGAVLKLESTNGNSAAVYVNGRKAPAFDFDRLAADISTLLIPGENIIQVEVSSTLNNRLIARKYYEEKDNPMAFPEGAMDGMDEEAMKENFSKLYSGFPKAVVQDYGMTGNTEFVTYTVEKI